VAALPLPLTPDLALPPPPAAAPAPARTPDTALAHARPAATPMSATVVVFVATLHVAALAGLFRDATPTAPPAATPLMARLVVEEQARSAPPAATPPAPRPAPRPRPASHRQAAPTTAPAPVAEAPVAEAPVTMPSAEPTPTPTAAPAAPKAPAATAPAAVPVSAPRFDAAYLNNPPPAYPPLSRRLGEEGRTVLRVFVDADGRPARSELATSSGSPRLDQAALAAVARWRFVPARQGETAVGAWVLVPIAFTLRH